MLRVHKFDVPIGGEFSIRIPFDAEPLTIEMQYGSPRMWVLLDPSADKMDRTFRVVPTGVDIYSECPVYDPVYVGTFMKFDGGLVFHVFEVTP
jgi:hypothetical protein